MIWNAPRLTLMLLRPHCRAALFAFARMVRLELDKVKINESKAHSKLGLTKGESTKEMGDSLMAHLANTSAPKYRTSGVEISPPKSKTTRSASVKGLCTLQSQGSDRASSTRAEGGGRPGLKLRLQM